MKAFASCHGEEFGQRLGVRGVSVLSHVHLDVKFLEVDPSFEKRGHGGGHDGDGGGMTMVFCKISPAMMPVAARERWR